MSCFKIPSSNQPGWNLQNPQGRFGTFQVHHLAGFQNPRSFGWTKTCLKKSSKIQVSLWKKSNLLFKYPLKLYYTGFLVNSEQVSFEISRPIQPTIYMLYLYCNCFFCAATSFCNFKGNTSNLAFYVQALDLSKDWWFFTSPEIFLLNSPPLPKSNRIPDSCAYWMRTNTDPGLSNTTIPSRIKMISIYLE